MIPLALTVFGATVTLSLLAFRAAELRTVPECVRTRVTWWRAHLAVLLSLSATVLIIGIVGLAHPTGGSP